MNNAAIARLGLTVVSSTKEISVIFPVFHEFVVLCSAHWLNLLQNVPCDAFGARRSGKGSGIGIKFGGISIFQVRLEVDDTSISGLGRRDGVNYFIDQSVVLESTLLAIKKHTKNTTECTILIQVNDM